MKKIQILKKNFVLKMNIIILNLEFLKYFNICSLANRTEKFQIVQKLVLASKNNLNSNHLILHFNIDHLLLISVQLFDF